MYPCPPCDRLFASATALAQHRKDSPMHAKTFKCRVCGRSFGSASALGQHQRDSNHTEPLQAPVAVGPASPASQASEPPDSGTGSGSPQGIGLPGRHAEKPTSGTSKKTKKNKKAARNLETREVFTFPELHDGVAEAIALQTSTRWFYETNSQDKHSRDYSTNIMGVFSCNNPACKKQSWGSKIVAVWIKQHARNRYSAMVYNQRCLRCKFLGDLKIDEACYIERVAYRLNKWAGVEMERPRYEPPRGDPHEIALCEGCKRGVCPQVKRQWD